MRTIGMIGGLGPESTIDYYRSIIARYRARRPDGGYPHVVINSLDVDKGITMLDAGRLDELADYLATGLENGFSVSGVSCSCTCYGLEARLKGENKRVFMFSAKGTIFIFGKKYLTDEQQ